MNQYQEQYGRVRRYYARFSALNNGRSHDMSSENYTDDVYAFFQNCYHLKDWIKNDPACAGWASMENYVNSCSELLLCADICNSMKHLRLSRPRSKENPTFGGRQIYLGIQDGSVEASVEMRIQYEIVTDTDMLDAFALASKCLAAWDSFIQDNGGTL